MYRFETARAYISENGCSGDNPEIGSCMERDDSEWRRMMQEYLFYTIEGSQRGFSRDGRGRLRVKDNEWIPRLARRKHRISEEALDERSSADWMQGHTKRVGTGCYDLVAY